MCVCVTELIVWVFVSVCLCTLCSHVQAFIQIDNQLKGMTEAHPLTPVPSLHFTIPILYPLSRPLLLPSSHSIPLWRGIVIIYSDMFWYLVLFCFFEIFFCLLLSVGTHPHTHSLSLNPSLCLFLLSPGRRRARKSYYMVCRFCGSHYVNLLFICCLCLLVHLCI